MAEHGPTHKPMTLYRCPVCEFTASDETAFIRLERCPACYARRPEIERFEVVYLASYRQLQEALEFYADESRYAPPVALPGGIMQDRGARARAALEGGGR